MHTVRELLETPPAAAIGGGVFVAAGPSGVGKDTLINHARAGLAGRPEFVFVRRIITRRPDAHLEDHDSLAPAAFEAATRDKASVRLTLHDPANPDRPLEVTLP